MQCPEHRSRQEEVPGAQATHVTTSVVILPVRRRDPGARQGDSRGLEGRVLPVLSPFTGGGSRGGGGMQRDPVAVAGEGERERESYWVLMSNC